MRLHRHYKILDHKIRERNLFAFDIFRIFIAWIIWIIVKKKAYPLKSVSIADIYNVTNWKMASFCSCHYTCLDTMHWIKEGLSGEGIYDGLV